MTRDRNYSHEMSVVLGRILESGDDIVVSVEASKLVAHLAETDPDLLRGWLTSNAEQFVSDALGARLRSKRAYVRRTSQARAFSTAAQSGDVTKLKPFQVRHIVDDHHTQRAVGQMTGDDHVFVAQSYDLSAQTSQMLAAFHRAVARKVGSRRTEEVMDEETYLRLYESIVRGD
jgi:hypothetical protein